LSEDELKRLRSAQAALASKGNIDAAAPRKAKLRDAILAVERNGTKLRISSKFADSIAEDVCKHAGVKLTDQGLPAERGFSVRTIQRMIHAILEDRKCHF
jgi:hypothetical protein